MKKACFLLTILALILSSCSSVLATPIDRKTPLPPVSSQPTAAPQPDVSALSRADLALRLGLPEDQVLILAVDVVDWPDTCLGLGKPDQACGEMIVSGYRVLLSANGQLFEYHTNQDGSQIILSDNIIPLSSNPSERLQQSLAARLVIPVTDVRLISFDEVTWPDGCLGIYEKDVACTEALVPGYRVVFEALGQRYELHTDIDSTYAKELPPQPALGDPLLVWQSATQPCRMAQITSVGIAQGACAGSLAVTIFSDTRHADELALLVSSFAPIAASTPAGDVDFRGSGSAAPAAAETRSLAEWAGLLSQVYSGTAPADMGILLSWKRVGGIAGFCDEMKIIRSGFVQTGLCASGATVWAPAVLRLDEDELQQVYSWADQYAPLNLIQSDAATADSMTITLSFNGQGSQDPAALDQTLLFTLCDEVFARQPQ